MLSFQIILHGFLLWASMGFLMPIGILVIRMANRHDEECGARMKVILYIHATLQILSFVLVTAAAIMSIGNFDNSFTNNHQRIGLAVYGAIWLQAATGIFKPDRYRIYSLISGFVIIILAIAVIRQEFMTRESKGRSIWFSVHWLLGVTVSLLGIINIYTGLQSYHTRTLSSTSVWNLAFTVEIVVILFIYLLQEKWPYIKQIRSDFSQ